MSADVNKFKKVAGDGSEDAATEDSVTKDNLELNKTKSTTESTVDTQESKSKTEVPETMEVEVNGDTPPNSGS